MKTINWLSIAEERLQEFLLLEDNWNGYGAAPISKKAIGRAKDILMSILEKANSEPTISPSPQGGVNFDWSEGSKLLTIKVRDDEIRFLLFNGSHYQKGNIPDDIDINKLISDWAKEK